MKLGSNCFLVNCDLALTMRKMCTVVGINESGYYKYLISPIDNPKTVYSALENCIRSPKKGKATKGVRIFD